MRATLVLCTFLAGCCVGGTTSPAPTTAPATAPVTPTPTPEATAPAEGTAVLANYHGLGRYYVGVVTAVGTDGVSVLYADGDSETLPAAGTMPDRLAAPMPAEWYDGTGYVPCTIERRTGHALGLAFPDGRRQWAAIAFVRIEPANLPALAPPIPPASPFGEPGSIVLAQYSRDGYWYEAVVGELVGELRRVVYADGASEDLPLTALRAGGVAVGARVESRVHGAADVQAGTVLRRIEHGVEVQLDSGERRWSALGDVRIAP